MHWRQRRPAQLQTALCLLYMMFGAKDRLLFTRFTCTPDDSAIDVRRRVIVYTYYRHQGKYQARYALEYEVEN